MRNEVLRDVRGEKDERRQGEMYVEATIREWNI
jgi:hypothetical protein